MATKRVVHKRIIVITVLCQDEFQISAGNGFHNLKQRTKSFNDLAVVCVKGNNYIEFIFAL